MASKFSPEQEKDIYLAYLKDPCYARVAGKFAIKPETVKAIKIRIKARAIQDDAVQSMGASTSTNAPIGNSFADYVKLRERGKTCADCVVQLQLTPEKAEEFEKAYLHVKDLDQCSAFAMRFREEPIDLELLIKEVENGSIRSFLQRLAEVKTRVSNERTKLAQIQCQYQRSLHNNQYLTKVNVDLNTSNHSLAQMSENLDHDIEDKIRTRDQISDQLDQTLADHERTFIENERKTTQAARKLIDVYVRDDLNKAVPIFAAIVWQLRNNPNALCELLSCPGPLRPDEAQILFHKFGILGFPQYFRESVLHQVVANAAADKCVDPFVCDRAEPWPTQSSQDAPIQIGPPSGTTIERLLPGNLQPQNISELFRHDKFSEDLARMKSIQDQELLTGLASSDEFQAVPSEYSHSFEPNPDPETCNDVQCKVT